MATFSLFGKSIDLPARPAQRSATADSEAWLHKQYLTVRLTGSVDALRVHTDGKAFSGRSASHLRGRWFAVGDVIQTNREYQSSRSLPGPFTHVAWVNLKAGCLLNLGLCSPLFGGAGREFQVEYIGGPEPNIMPTPHKWHFASGEA